MPSFLYKGLGPMHRALQWDTLQWDPLTGIAHSFTTGVRQRNSRRGCRARKWACGPRTVSAFCNITCACSSTGESNGLLSRRFQVRVLAGAPLSGTGKSWQVATIATVSASSRRLRAAGPDEPRGLAHRAREPSNQQGPHPGPGQTVRCRGRMRRASHEGIGVTS